jgi:hypothetical protein
VEAFLVVPHCYDLRRVVDEADGYL